MLRELKTFLAVVRHGSFAAAGQHVGLTQSAVSAQIQKLEQTLGVPLFERTGRSAVLNSAGRDAVPRAEQMVSLFDEMAARLRSPMLRGVLRVGSIQTVQGGLLPEALKLMRAEHPEVRVRVLPGSSLALVGQVDSAEIDAALMVEPPFELPRELVWQPLLREPFALIVPRNAVGKDWRQLLSQHAFIRYNRTSFGGRGVDKFLRQEGLHTQDAIEVEEVDAVIHMVSRGLGASLVPLTRARPLNDEVTVVPLGPATFYREVGMVGRKESDPRGLVRAFSECLVRAARGFPTAHPGLAKTPPD